MGVPHGHGSAHAISGAWGQAKRVGPLDFGGWRLIDLKRGF
jgi:hypothetical protein